MMIAKFGRLELNRMGLGSGDWHVRLASIGSTLESLHRVSFKGKSQIQRRLVHGWRRDH